MNIGAVTINSALIERRDSLEGQLIAQESARFFKGDICVLDGSGPDTSAIYPDDDPVAWMENLAGWLLAGSYPTLLMDADNLTNSLCEDEIGGVLSAILNQPGAPDSVERRN